MINRSSLIILLNLAVVSIRALPMMRTAPMECPLEDGNLLDVVLFAGNDAGVNILQKIENCSEMKKKVFRNFQKFSIVQNMVESRIKLRQASQF